MQLATTEKHEPFQQCCNTVSFWFKHTHSRTLSVHTTKGGLQLFQELLGKVNAADPQGCPNTPALFPYDSLHILSVVSIPFLLQKYSVVLHSCSIPTKPVDIIVLKWRL